MVDMLVEQNGRNIAGPLTPVSSPGGGSNSSRNTNHHHHHHQHHIHLHHSASQPTSNLSPQTSSSSSSTTSCNSNSSSSGTSDTSSPMRDDRSQCTPVKEEREETEEDEVVERAGAKPEEKFSALQRLQFALEKNTLFSGLYANGGEVKEGVNSEKKGKTDFGDFGVRRRTNKMLSMGTPQSSDDEGGVGGGPMMNAEDYSRSDEDEDMMMVASPEEENDNESNGTGGGNGNNAGNIFECPLCSVTCNSRHQFNEHLVSHSQQHACPKCSFLTNDDEALRAHLQDAHDIQSPEGAVADDDVASPRINSQGKVKTFKCKQCEFKTDTKLKFWEHSKSHIRQEKMLTCPKCPFVTEYKHHLEYHLRNHFGSKPFQCTKCSYSCVNKSMLNSHLKSHSNVYQYRCADCSYATKYCHSLKLHLRKYSHNPSMVLNLDGTPNPLPIIDVYGTRRGPKVKRSGDGSQAQQTDVIVTKSPPNSTMMIKNELKKRCHSNSAKNDGKISPKLVTLKREESTPPPTMVPNRKYNVQPVATAGSDSDDTSNGPFLKQQQHSYRMPETPVTPGSLGGFSPNRPEHHHHHHIQAAAAAAAAAAAVAGKNPLEFYAALNQYILASNLPLIHMVPNLAKEQQSQILNHILTNQQQQQQQQSMHHQVPSSPPATVLTSPRSPFMSSPPVGAPADENQFAALDLRNPRSSVSNFTQSIDEKRAKRKGKAVRYDRKMILTEEADDEEDEDQVIDFSNNNRLSKPAADMNSMVCKYCQISFADPRLYTMHMSYHSGDSDPWLCKSCGKRTKDRVAFSIHLTADRH